MPPILFMVTVPLSINWVIVRMPLITAELLGDKLISRSAVRVVWSWDSIRHVKLKISTQCTNRYEKLNQFCHADLLYVSSIALCHNLRLMRDWQFSNLWIWSMTKIQLPKHNVRFCDIRKISDFSIADGVDGGFIPNGRIPFGRMFIFPRRTNAKRTNAI